MILLCGSDVKKADIIVTNKKETTSFPSSIHTDRDINIPTQIYETQVYHTSNEDNREDDATKMTFQARSNIHNSPSPRSICSEIRCALYEDNNHKQEYDDDDEFCNSCSFEEINECEDNSELTFKKYGGIDVLQTHVYDTAPMVESPDNILIKITASTVSLLDTFIRRGVWNRSIPLPTSPGFDFTCTIIKIGDNVTSSELYDYNEGDKIVGLIGHGGNSSYISLPASSNRIFKVPRGMDDAEVVCMINIYMTSYQALYRARPLARKQNLEGKKILITEADTPYGQALIQLLCRAGGVSTIYATTSKEEHSDFLRFLGAIPLSKNSSQWLPVVENQIDVCFDISCTDNYESSRRALNSNGQLICIGMNSVYATFLPGCLSMSTGALWAEMKAKNFMSKTFFYDVLESCDKYPLNFKHDLDYLFDLLKRKKIRPNISEYISLSDVPNAHMCLETGQATGFIICQPWRTAMSLT